MKKLITAFVLLFVFQSCSFDTPENYFDRTTLNTNKFIDFGSKKIKRMIAQRDNDMLFVQNGKDLEKTNSLEQHIKTYLLPDLENDMQKIKDLKPTEETKALIAASLDVFGFVKQKYQNDYIEIAKLVDTNAPTEKIEAALEMFDEENLPELYSLQENLMTIAFDYAEANGIQAKRF